MPRHPKPLTERFPDPPEAGPHAVQVLRTYGAKRPRFPFAPEGERSIARVHAKVCIVDDVWFTCGSVNRRSWSNDSVLTCAVIDSKRDGREPIDSAGLGDGARRLRKMSRLARQVRSGGLYEGLL